VNKSESLAPLTVATDDLTVAIDGAEFDVRSTGDRLFVEVPTVRAAVRLARSLASETDTTGPTRLLVATDLSVEVRVRGRTVAVLGATARPGPVARWLAVAPAEPRVAGVLGAGWDGLSAAVNAARRLVG
jgi:hypothetical protein